jgi:hypothetical protein
MNRETKSATFDDGLLNLINRSVKVGDVVMTLGRARPNRIAWINGDGVWVSTEKSDREGTGPQLVPAWMIAAAWYRLVQRGRLSQQELLDELNVKRSAFVCALLARFPDVEVETGPSSLAQPVALGLSSKAHRETELTSAHRVKFHWEHNPDTHEDYTVDCPWGVYYKLQASCSDDGNCSGGSDDWYGRTCGRPWGGQRRGQYWCRIVYSDGREEWVSEPGTSKGRTYSAFLAHKESVRLVTGSAEGGSQSAPIGEDMGEHESGGSEFQSNLSEPGSAESREAPVRADEPPLPRPERPLDRAGLAAPAGSAEPPERFDRYTYAERLNHLFATVHPEARGPYTSEEVAESLQADGIPLHVNSISRLRNGADARPADRITQALAFFFDVDPEYLTEGVDAETAAEHTNQIPSQEDSPWDDRGDADQVIQEPNQVTRSYGVRLSQGADIELSVSELVRVVAGLGQATRACFESSNPDRALVQRLVFLLSDAGPLLLQGIIGNVDVSRGLLERVEVAWAETVPGSNGTEMDYRWLRERLGRP